MKYYCLRSVCILYIIMYVYTEHVKDIFHFIIIIPDVQMYAVITFLFKIISLLSRKKINFKTFVRIVTTRLRSGSEEVIHRRSSFRMLHAPQLNRFLFKPHFLVL